MPAQARVLDQGTIGDAMYYVVSGSLLKRYLQGPGGIPIGIIKQGECFCERRLIEVGPCEETVESLEPCKLYRFRTRQFLDALAPFPGIYEGLIKLSWKRVAEWKSLNKPGGDVKNPGGLPFRWNQLTGPAYHAAKSKTIRAEIQTEALDTLPSMKKIMDVMSERRGSRSATPPSQWPPNIKRWGDVDLLLNTKHDDIKPQEVDTRATDWWKDTAILTEADSMMQARSQHERLRAIENRSSALAWRKYQMKRLGDAMVNSIS